MAERRFAHVDLGQMLYSVVAMKSEGQLLRPVIYGTAFCVGPGMFVTAGHVLSMIADDGGKVALSHLDEDRGLLASMALQTEIIAGSDVGIIAAKAEGVALLDWAEEPRSILSDVSAIGFPYAITSQENPASFKVTMRGFKGNVITRTKIWKLPAQPVGYEVSCPFPKGLSGAPLLDATPPVPDLKVIGMVLEATRFGLALDVIELRAVASPKIIGGTLNELRKAVLTGDQFRFAVDRPFLNWDRRKRA